jgi:hypothetical protein
MPVPSYVLSTMQEARPSWAALGYLFIVRLMAGLVKLASSPGLARPAALSNMFLICENAALAPKNLLAAIEQRQAGCQEAQTPIW